MHSFHRAFLLLLDTSSSLPVPIRVLHRDYNRQRNPHSDTTRKERKSEKAASCVYTAGHEKRERERGGNVCGKIFLLVKLFGCVCKEKGKADREGSGKDGTLSYISFQLERGS